MLDPLGAFGSEPTPPDASEASASTARQTRQRNTSRMTIPTLARASGLRSAR